MWKGAVLLAYWRFDIRSERTATLTQAMESRGEHAGIDEIKTALETNLELGMRRIALRPNGATLKRACCGREGASWRPALTSSCR